MYTHDHIILFSVHANSGLIPRWDAEWLSTPLTVVASVALPHCHKLRASSFLPGGCRWLKPKRCLAKCLVWRVDWKHEVPPINKSEFITSCLHLCVRFSLPSNVAAGTTRPIRAGAPGVGPLMAEANCLYFLRVSLRWLGGQLAPVADINTSRKKKTLSRYVTCHLFICLNLPSVKTWCDVTYLELANSVRVV